MSSPAAPRPTAPFPGSASGDAPPPGPAFEATGPPPAPGTTEVVPEVVAKVAAIAAREIPGVVGLGGSAARALGAVRQGITGEPANPESSAGVRVELANQAAHIGMDVVIEYRVGAVELVRALRRTIPPAVEEIAGVPVVELNIVITDVRLPGEDPATG